MTKEIEAATKKLLQSAMEYMEVKSKDMHILSSLVSIAAPEGSTIEDYKPILEQLGLVVVNTGLSKCKQVKKAKRAEPIANIYF